MIPTGFVKERNCGKIFLPYIEDKASSFSTAKCFPIREEFFLRLFLLEH